MNIVESILFLVAILSTVFVFRLFKRKEDGKIYFLLVYVTLLLLSLCDGISLLVDGNEKMVAVNSILSCFSFLLWLALGIFTMMITISKSQRLSLLNRVWMKLLMILPGVVYVALVISSYWTGWIFYIDSFYTYQTGPLYFFSVACLDIYFAIPLVICIHSILHAETVRMKNTMYALSALICVPTILSVVYNVIGGNGLFVEHIVSVCLVIEILVSEENLITVDELTQLPNRSRLEAYLVERISDFRDHGEEFYVLMGDINDFKLINDNYGHLEGDFALQSFGKLGAKYIQEKGIYLGRYGGDEFVFVLRKTEEEVIRFIDRVNQDLMAATTDKKYKIQMAIGYAKFEKWMSITDAIKCADEDCYRKKHRMKSEQ